MQGFSMTSPSFIDAVAYKDLIAHNQKWSNLLSGMQQDPVSAMVCA